MTLGDFAARLEAHGLRYVGEAGPRSAVVELEDAWGLAPESMAGRWLDAEAALDVALSSRFRRALICRDDAPFAQPPRADALDRLALYADLRSDEEIDLENTVEQNFINPAGNTFPIALPAMKAAAMALSAAYPNALGYPDLLAAACQVLAEFGAGEDVDEIAFGDALFMLVMAHGVLPTVSDIAYVNEPGDHPRAHALARLQAISPGWVVSGSRHVAMDLDEPGRILLGLLDGSRTVDQLVDAMHAALAERGWTGLRETVNELTWQQLWLFARQGLLLK